VDIIFLLLYIVLNLNSQIEFSSSSSLFFLCFFILTLTGGRPFTLLILKRTFRVDVDVGFVVGFVVVTLRF
tara:strand:- start:241 stop:453 length:213 start_codon:yes stop_codon:yes gene_type:complete